MTHDALDHLTTWSAGSSTEQYVYDAVGERVLTRSTTGSTTSLTSYAFGSEEHHYTGSGQSQNDLYYYVLGGRLIGELVPASFPAHNFFLSDALGSLLLTFSNTQNSPAVQGNQVYGPYGASRYQSGTLGTAKGFTGQYADSVSGLDYYHARYYDPTVGVFLSADRVQGNAQGMNPYDYVGGNPETMTDPSGHIVLGNPGPDHGEEFGHVTSDGGIVAYTDPNVYVDNGAIWYRYTGWEVRSVPIYDWRTDSANSPGAKLAQTTGWDKLSHTWGDPHASWQDKWGALRSFLGTNGNNLLQLAMIFGTDGEGEGLEFGGEAALEHSGSLPEIAQTLANQIKETMVSKGGWWFRKEATVGVAYMTDSEDVLQRFVTINETALAKWGEQVQSILGPEDRWIQGIPAGDRHAEEVLVDYAKSTGSKIVGLGASTTFCPPCGRMLLEEVGQEFLGQVVP